MLDATRPRIREAWPVWKLRGRTWIQGRCISPRTHPALRAAWPHAVNAEEPAFQGTKMTLKRVCPGQGDTGTTADGRALQAGFRTPFCSPGPHCPPVEGWAPLCPPMQLTAANCAAADLAARKVQPPGLQDPQARQERGGRRGPARREPAGGSGATPTFRAHLAAPQASAERRVTLAKPLLFSGTPFPQRSMRAGLGDPEAPRAACFIILIASY